MLKEREARNEGSVSPTLDVLYDCVVGGLWEMYSLKE